MPGATPLCAGTAREETMPGDPGWRRGLADRGTRFVFTFPARAAVVRRRGAVRFWRVGISDLDR
jgi:hypothetical protein